MIYISEVLALDYLVMDVNICKETDDSFHYYGSLYNQVYVKEEKLHKCDEEVQFQYKLDGIDEQVAYEETEYSEMKAGNTDMFKTEYDKMMQLMKEEFIDESEEVKAE